MILIFDSGKEGNWLFSNIRCKVELDKTILAAGEVQFSFRLFKGGESHGPWSPGKLYLQAGRGMRRLTFT